MRRCVEAVPRFRAVMSYRLASAEDLGTGRGREWAGEVMARDLRIADGPQTGHKRTYMLIFISPGETKNGGDLRS